MFGKFAKTSRRRELSSGMTYGALEGKRLLAGNVTVANTAHLFIRGDAADNQIEVIGNEDGTLAIIGVEGTTINRSSEPLIISGDALERITTGDVVASFENGLRAHMGPGNDKIYVQGIEFQDSSFVFGGTGDDIVSVLRASFTDQLVMQTYSGDDAIGLDESKVDGDLRIIGHDGADAIGVLGSEIFGDTIVSGGNGNDRMTVGHYTEATGSFLAIGGDGDDNIGLVWMQNDDFLGAFGGAGNDEVYVQTSGLNLDELGPIRVGGQAGADGYSSYTEDPPVQIGTFEIFADQREEDGSTRSFVFTNDQFFISDMRARGALVPTMFSWIYANGGGTLNTLFYEIESYDFASGRDLTFFAPTDAAFEKLGDALDGLTKEQIEDILSFHFTDEAIFASDLVEKDSVDTLLGSSFPVSVSDDGVLLNNNATLSTTDIRTKNGVVHVLNDVLIPATDA